MATLVFGGAGFVGLNIAERLLAAGRDAVLFDRSPPPAAAAAALSAHGGRLHVVVGDVRDRADVSAAFDRAVDTVVFGAAITADAARDAAEPEAVLEVNLLAFVHALRAARAAGVRRVVNLSSASAYGQAGFEHPLLDEAGTPPDPRSLYALTKFGTERAGARLGELWGLDVRSVRLSGVFGPWERATGARDTLSPQHQVLRLARAARAAVLERPGERDWTYATDVARAIVALLDAPAPRHALYNVSTGARWSVLDWGRAVAALRPGFECRLARSGETPTVDLHSPADRASMAVARAREDLGFAAEYGLERSARDYVEWSARHPWCFDAP